MQGISVGVAEPTTISAVKYGYNIHITLLKLLTFYVASPLSKPSYALLKIMVINNNINFFRKLTVIIIFKRRLAFVTGLCPQVHEIQWFNCIRVIPMALTDVFNAANGILHCRFAFTSVQSLRVELTTVNGFTNSGMQILKTNLPSN